VGSGRRAAAQPALHPQRHRCARRDAARRRPRRHVRADWYDTPAAALPHLRPADDKRRHFVREEVAACKQLRDVDILLTHEAARPFILTDPPRPGARPRRLDAGKPAINEVLAAMQPRLHLCGHHHRFAETEREGVRSVCVDRINRSYLLIDTTTFEYEKIDQPCM
jgi:hypothetical protein